MSDLSEAALARGGLLVRVEAPHFVAGIIFRRRGKFWLCEHAAPILGWCVGRDAHTLRYFFTRYGWTAKRCPEAAEISSEEP